MRALLPVCAGLALLSSVASVKFWLDLKEERAANKALQTQLSGVRVPDNRFAAVPATVATSASAPAASGAEVPAIRPDPSPRGPQVANTGRGGREGQNNANIERELMKSPEYRKLRLAQQRSNVERNFPGLAEALGISDGETDRIFDLMAEQQLAMDTQSQQLNGNGNGNRDPAAGQEMGRQRQALQRQQEESLRAMLGSKYNEYQAYQQSRPARNQVMDMNQQLAQAGVPLTDTQARALTATMITEQQRQRQASATMNRSQAQNVGNPADPNDRARRREESLKRTEENNRRLLDAAASTLNSRQLAALREEMEQQVAQNRISMQMQVERDRVQSQLRQNQPPQR